LRIKMFSKKLMGLITLVVILLSFGCSVATSTKGSQNLSQGNFYCNNSLNTHLHSSSNVHKKSIPLPKENKLSIKPNVVIKNRSATTESSESAHWEKEPTEPGPK
jgi:hypothetical protein